MVSTYQIHTILTPKKEKVNLIENSLIHYPTQIHRYLSELSDADMQFLWCGEYGLNHAITRLLCVWYKS